MELGAEINTKGYVDSARDVGNGKRKCGWLVQEEVLLLTLIMSILNRSTRPIRIRMCRLLTLRTKRARQRTEDVEVQTSL